MSVFKKFMKEQQFVLPKDPIGSLEWTKLQKIWMECSFCWT